jgi:dienelactone hydrolase
MSDRAERIPLEGDERLEADLSLPLDPAALVVFAHGSGSGRRSPRNREVAVALIERGFATLLVDLLTAEEARRDERTGELRFDVGLLGERVGTVVDWLAGSAELGRLHLGLFGASTGVAAALIAAARAPDRVQAVVSRGGRPDLAADALLSVKAPTLLLVGGEDHHVLGLNREAQQRLSAPSRLEIIAGAGHLFEEPGAMAQVAALAGDWFAEHLG